MRLLGLVVLVALAGCGSRDAGGRADDRDDDGHRGHGDRVRHDGADALAVDRREHACLGRRARAGRRLFQQMHDSGGLRLLPRVPLGRDDEPGRAEPRLEVTEADLAPTPTRSSPSGCATESPGACVAPTDPARCMPPGLYSGADADAIAVFVATCAGRKHSTGCQPEPSTLTARNEATGEKLYHNRGCVGCHSSTRAGRRRSVRPCSGSPARRSSLADGDGTVERRHLTRVDRRAGPHRS